jgi:hypothetical protein
MYSGSVCARRGSLSIRLSTGGEEPNKLLVELGDGKQCNLVRVSEPLVPCTAWMDTRRGGDVKAIRPDLAVSAPLRRHCLIALDVEVQSSCRLHNRGRGDEVLSAASIEVDDDEVVGDPPGLDADVERGIDCQPLLDLGGTGRPAQVGPLGAAVDRLQHLVVRRLALEWQQRVPEVEILERRLARGGRGGTIRRRGRHCETPAHAASPPRVSLFPTVGRETLRRRSTSARVSSSSRVRAYSVESLWVMTTRSLRPTQSAGSRP